MPEKNESDIHLVTKTLIGTIVVECCGCGKIVDRKPIWSKEPLIDLKTLKELHLRECQPKVQS